MVTLRSRGEIIAPTETVQLRATFYDLNGNLTNLSSFPQVTIIQPTGAVALGPTSSGVYLQSTGVYGYDFTPSISPQIGVWSDFWQGVIPSGQTATRDLNFVVQITQMPIINSDGYYALGDDVGFNYSQCAIYNINKVLKALRARLRSSGMTSSKDQFGNNVYVTCDIFSVDTLVTFIAQALSFFNSVPHFTHFTFEDTPIIGMFLDELVEVAFAYALSSQALIEKGVEFTVNDNGVSFTPTSLADLINTESNFWFTAVEKRISAIKLNMKPAPIAIGSMWGNLGRAPAFARLRHLRARQII